MELSSGMRARSSIPARNIMDPAREAGHTVPRRNG